MVQRTTMRTICDWRWTDDRTTFTHGQHDWGHSAVWDAEHGDTDTPQTEQVTSNTHTEVKRKKTGLVRLQTRSCVQVVCQIFYYCKTSLGTNCNICLSCLLQILGPINCSLTMCTF